MNPLQLLQMLPQLQQNPAAFLQQRGIPVPQGMNDPNAILKWFVDNGKATQAQIDQLKSSLGINR